jgi:carbamoyltransferase
MENGRVLACLSEERLLREKEWKGFPELSIKQCLEISGKSPPEFDAIGICSLLPQIGGQGYYSPSLIKRAFGYVSRVVPQSVLQKESNIHPTQKVLQYASNGRRKDHARRIRELGFNCPFDFYEHHMLHAVTAYYTNWNRPDPCLIITLDGSGDGVCGSVSIGENGQIRVSCHNLGWLR